MATAVWLIKWVCVVPAREGQGVGEPEYPLKFITEVCDASEAGAPFLQ